MAIIFVSPHPTNVPDLLPLHTNSAFHFWFDRRTVPVILPMSDPRPAGGTGK